jgi:hypothetical protein
MINWDKYDKCLLKVTKLKDVAFPDGHPSGIREGDMHGGYFNLDISKKQNVLYITDHSRWFHTSLVEKQIECDGYDLLQTLNSVYKVEIVK